MVLQAVRLALRHFGCVSGWKKSCARHSVVPQAAAAQPRLQQCRATNAFLSRARMLPAPVRPVLCAANVPAKRGQPSAIVHEEHRKELVAVHIGRYAVPIVHTLCSQRGHGTRTHAADTAPAYHAEEALALHPAKGRHIGLVQRHLHEGRRCRGRLQPQSSSDTIAGAGRADGARICEVGRDHPASQVVIEQPRRPVVGRRCAARQGRLHTGQVAARIEEKDNRWIATWCAKS